MDNKISCYYCYKNYSRVDYYKNHLKNKHNREEDVNEILANLELARPFVCDECGKDFKNSDYLYKHKNDCITDYQKIIKIIKKHRLNNQEINDIIKELNIDKKINGQNISFSGDNNTNTNSFNNTFITQNNVVVLNVGNENLDMLNDELLQEIFTQLEDEQNKEIKQVGSFEYTWYKKKSLKDAILKIFQTIHCNEHYPQNHNLYTGNKNPYSGFSLVKNGIWKETNDVNELRDIFLRCKERLIELIQCNIEFNDEYIQKILHDQIKNLGLNFNNEEELKNSMCHDLLKEVYTHRELIGKTKRLSINLQKKKKLKFKSRPKIL